MAFFDFVDYFAENVLDSVRGADLTLGHPRERVEPPLDPVTHIHDVVRAFCHSRLEKERQEKHFLVFSLLAVELV